MREMVRRFLRQKSGSVGTWIALGLIALIAALPLNAGQGFGSLDTFALIALAAGSVSRDASSGALQMILSRPITRTGYLAGRYVGIAVAFAAFLLGSALLAALLGQIVLRLTPSAASPMSIPDTAIACADSFLRGALVAAALLLFSTFLRGLGDVLALALFTVLFGSARSLGEAFHLPALSRAGQLAQDNLSPSVSWSLLLRGQGMPAEAVGRYLLALFLFWTLAAVVFSRREFSYGQD